MLANPPRLFPLVLAGLLSLPLAATAQAQATDEPSAHHPEPSQATVPAQTASIQDLRQAMRARMMEIRATQDPERRRQLLEAHMQDMEAMLEAGACPQPGGGMMGGRGGQGMMGRGAQHPGMGGMGMHSGMACGMGGPGMQHGRGRQAGMDDATLRRLEALEKRVDLLQMLLQMQAR